MDEELIADEAVERLLTKVGYARLSSLFDVVYRARRAVNYVGGGGVDRLRGFGNSE